MTASFMSTLFCRCSNGLLNCLTCLFSSKCLFHIYLLFRTSTAGLLRQYNTFDARIIGVASFFSIPETSLQDKLEQKRLKQTTLKSKVFKKVNIGIPTLLFEIIIIHCSQAMVIILLIIYLST